MPKLEIGNTTYELNMDDSYTSTSGKNEGIIYEYVSLKQLVTNRDGTIVKNRQVTVKHENWREFLPWLLKELDAEKGQQEINEPPEEKTEMELF